MYSPPWNQAEHFVLRMRSASCRLSSDRAKALLFFPSSPASDKASFMPFFPSPRNNRIRLKGGNSARRMGNSRRPARRASHSGAGATRHMGWLRDLDQAFEDGYDPTVNTSQSLAGNVKNPQPEDLDAVSNSHIPIPRFPIPPPPPPPSGPPPPSQCGQNHGFVNTFDDAGNVLDAVSKCDSLIPPSPSGSTIPSKADHKYGFIDPFDDTAIWKTLKQYSSMQRMIRELGEEVQTRQQTILSLKDEHAAELKKRKEGHTAELQKIRDEYTVELKKTKDRCDEIVEGVREKELATLELEVENLENENAELKDEIAAMKKRFRHTKEWGVKKIESMGFALEDMMLELEKRMGDDEN